MGNPKQKWTSEEEEALRAGVAKHGAGKWKNIQRDPEFNHLLFARSNIDLKDKWRNLSVANGQGPREKSKTPKTKTNPAATPLLPLAAVTPDDVVMLDSSSRSSLPQGNNAAKRIIEAGSVIKSENKLVLDTVEEASICAAYKIAEAENKSFVAAESVKEAERVSTMAQEMEVILQFAIHCYDQSALGEIMLMAC